MQTTLAHRLGPRRLAPLAALVLPLLVAGPMAACSSSSSSDDGGVDGGTTADGATTGNEAAAPGDSAANDSAVTTNDSATDAQVPIDSASMPPLSCPAPDGGLTGAGSVSLPVGSPFAVPAWLFNPPVSYQPNGPFGISYSCPGAIAFTAGSLSVQAPPAPGTYDVAKVVDAGFQSYSLGNSIMISPPQDSGLASRYVAGYDTYGTSPMGSGQIVVSSYVVDEAGVSANGSYDVMGSTGSDAAPPQHFTGSWSFQSLYLHP